MAIILNNQFYGAYINRGRLFLEVNEFSRALLDINNAIRLEPNISTAYAFQAEAYTALGLGQKGLAAAQRAVELGYDPQALESKLRKLRQPAAPQQQGLS